jgi:hypothetical protein
MAAKSSRSSSSNAANDLLAPMSLASDFARQQISLIAETSCALLGSTDAVSRIQQQAVHEASTRHEAAAEMLRADIEPTDVLTIQTELLREDMQQAAQYWTQLASIAMKSQMDMMSRMAGLLGSGTQGGIGAAMDNWRHSVMAAAPDGTARAGVH